MDDRAPQLALELRWRQAHSGLEYREIQVEELFQPFECEVLRILGRVELCVERVEGTPYFESDDFTSVNRLRDADRPGHFHFCSLGAQTLQFGQHLRARAEGIRREHGQRRVQIHRTDA